MNKISKHYFAISGAFIATLLIAVSLMNKNINLNTLTASPSTYASGSPQFGVLQSTPANAGILKSKGLKLVTLEIGWDAYEPQDGQFNSTYINDMKAKIQTYQDNGMYIVLDLGMQYPPAWVKSIEPWKDQYGNSNANEINTWNATVQQKMTRYAARVLQDFGSNTFWGVRVGSGNQSEMLLPDSAPNQQFSYWAFSPSALSSNPVPNWRPGNASPNNEAATFYNWYLNHLIKTVDLIQTTVRQYHNGKIILVMPGLGVRGNGWTTLISNNLVPTGAVNVDGAGRAAVWDKLVDGISNKTNVVIDCSSVGDSSATASWVDESSTDVTRWSAAHWIASIADKYGLEKMAENPGANSYSDMQVVFKQLKQFGYNDLMWAFENQLFTTQYATLDQYVQTINTFYPPSITTTTTPITTPIATPTPTAAPTIVPTPTITPSSSPSTSSKSKIVIYAKGTKGGSAYPTLNLYISEQKVASFQNISSYKSYSYIYPTQVSASQIKIEFPNDYFTQPKDDRNLYIDKVVINGKTYQTESSSTYVVGGGNSCGTGYLKTEWLNCNGYFKYAQ